MKKYWLYQKLLPIIIAMVLTVIFLLPILRNFSTHLTSRADGIFISWTIYTVSNLLSIGKNIFQMPIFHPFTNTLAYSDPFLPTAILTIPLLKFTKNIVLIHNFHLVTGTIVMYISSYLLAREIKYSKISSHFTAVFFTFSTIHLHYLVHLHTYLIAGIPLTFFFFVKWLNKNNWKWLALATTSFLYQSLNAPMTGLFLVFSLIPFLFNKKILLKIKNNFVLVSSYFIATISALILIYFPYFKVSQEFDYTRTIRDSAHFAHSLERLIQPDLLIIYLLIFIFWITRNKTQISINKFKTHFNISKKVTTYIAIIGAVLMLGPVLKINGETFKIFNYPIPLPYAVLYYVVPGFKAFRASSRWIILLNFGLSLLLGNLVNNSKIKHYFKILTWCCLIILQYFLHTQNFKIYAIPQEIPKIYENVKNYNQETVLAEFPVYSWGMVSYAFLENDRLLFQTYHNKKLYNGVSGFTPPVRETQWDWLWKEFPNNQAISRLKKEGINLIIIHYDLYEKMNNENFVYANHKSPSTKKLEEKINKQTKLELINCEENKCLYKL